MAPKTNAGLCIKNGGEETVDGYLVLLPLFSFFIFFNFLSPAPLPHSSVGPDST